MALPDLHTKEQPGDMCKNGLKFHYVANMLFTIFQSFWL